MTPQQLRRLRQKIEAASQLAIGDGTHVPPLAQAVLVLNDAVNIQLARIKALEKQVQVLNTEVQSLKLKLSQPRR